VTNSGENAAPLPAPRSMGRRVTEGFLANVLGRAWVVGIQIFSLPALTAAWGAPTYGIWLMLTALPTYIALSDFGFGTAVGIEMLRRHQNADFYGAEALFQSLWTAVTAAVLVVVGLTFLAWGLVEMGIPSTSADTKQIVDAATIMAVYALLCIQMVVIYTGYRSTGHYARGTLLLELQLPIEGVAVMIAANLGGGIIEAAWTVLAARGIGLGFYVFTLRSIHPWLRLRWRPDFWSEIRNLAKPALAAFNITLSQAMMIQGVVLSLGFFGSPVMAATFGAARTLARAPLQMISLVTRATLPELSAAHARRDTYSLIKLTVLNIVSAAFLFVPAGIILVGLGPWALFKLSHGKIIGSEELFVWLTLMLAFQISWNTVAQFLFAANKQQSFSLFYTFLALFAVISPAIGKKAQTMDRAVIVSCIAEGVMAVVVFSIWRREQPIQFSDLKHPGLWKTLVPHSLFFHTLKQKKGSSR
jgi:O-antigen/teichoic acid export membrane protein